MKEDFKKSINRGMTGEAAVLEYLYRLPECKRVIDARHDKRLQSVDIDFLAEMLTGEVLSIEVKTDAIAHKTNNLAYELTTSGNIGCFEKTKADRVFYYIAGDGRLYSIIPQQIRKHIKENVYNLISMGDYAKGYLIPINVLEAHGIARLLFKYEGIN